MREQRNEQKNDKIPLPLMRGEGRVKSQYNPLLPQKISYNPQIFYRGKPERYKYRNCIITPCNLLFTISISKYLKYFAPLLFCLKAKKKNSQNSLLQRLFFNLIGKASVKIKKENFHSFVEKSFSKNSFKKLKEIHCFMHIQQLRSFFGYHAIILLSCTY